MNPRFRKCIRGTIMSVDHLPDELAGALRKGASAAFGATITALLMTPLDVAKTRQQSGRRAGGGGRGAGVWPVTHASAVSCARPPGFGLGGGGHAAACVQLSCANLATRQPVFPGGAVATLRFVLRHEGARALWGGLSPTLLSQVRARARAPFSIMRIRIGAGQAGASDTHTRARTNARTRTHTHTHTHTHNTHTTTQPHTHTHTHTHARARAAPRVRQTCGRGLSIHECFLFVFAGAGHDCVLRAVRGDKGGHRARRG